jgi:hypothetical protein
MMKHIVIFTFIALTLSFCACPKNKSVKTTNSLEKALIGNWVSTNSDFTEKEKTTKLYYGELQEDGFGKYFQKDSQDKEGKYRIIEIDESQRIIKIGRTFTSREIEETLTFNLELNQITNNIVTLDNYSINTYYRKVND